MKRYPWCVAIPVPTETTPGDETSNTRSIADRVLARNQDRVLVIAPNETTQHMTTVRAAMHLPTF